MLEKIKLNKLDIFMTLFIITPILASLCNVLNISTYMAFYIPNIIMFGLSLKAIILNIKNIKKTEIILTIIFFICSLIACLLSKNKTEAFLGNDYRLEGMITYLSYIGFFYCGLKGKINHKKINLLIIVALIISIITLTKSNLTYYLFNHAKDEYYFYTGPFNQFNHFGYYLLIVNITTIFMFINTKKIKYLLANLLLTYTLVINDTFGVYISYFIILIILTICTIIRKQKLKQLILIVISFILISCITYRDGYNIVIRNISGLKKDTQVIINNKEEISTVGTNRGELWMYAIKFIKEKPIGYGFDNIKYEYHRYNVGQSRPHNLILEQTLNSGIIGALAYLTLITILIVKAIKQINNMHYIQIMSLTIVIAYLISSMFGNSTFYISPYFYLFLGIISNRKATNEI